MQNEPIDADEVNESGSDTPDPAFEALLRDVAEAPRLAAGLLTTAAFHPPEANGIYTLPQPRALPAVGEVIDDRYLIQVELGRGGMGVVFGARNLRTEREVALKWMLPRGLMRTAAERRDSVMRFVREARAVSRVDHPNVVRVLDVGGDPESPYLVMERLEGESLGARLARGPLSWDEALPILLPVLHGVAAAHKAGVVHRDLKPDNIFLCDNMVKVLDFGVSRIGGSEDYSTLTRTGTILGTPAYMPLEQLRGSREIDARTDVYALGVILFEALSGRLPFDAQTAADQAVLLATRGPEPLAELVPSLRGARADVVMKALSKNPGERYASVDELAQALSAAAAGPARSPQTVRWLVAAVALAALGAGVWQTLRTESVEPAVRTPSVAARVPITTKATNTDASPTAAPAQTPAAAPALLREPGSDAPVVGPGVRSPKGTAVGKVPVARPAATTTTSTSTSTSLSADQFRASDVKAAQQGVPTGNGAPTTTTKAVVSPALRSDEF